MLFPKYKRETSLTKKNILQLMQLQKLSILLLKEALSALHQKKFSRFDPDVGDGGCHIRTHFILNALDSFTEKKIYPALLDQKLHAIESWLSLPDHLQKKEFKLRRHSVDSFLRAKNFDFEFTPTQQRITLSYFLTAFQKKSFLDETPHIGYSLVKTTKEFLQKTTIDYIQKSADNLKLNPGSFLSPVFLQELQKACNQIDGTHGKRAVPCIVGMYILLQKMIQQRTILALFVTTYCSYGFHQFTLTFQMHPEKPYFSYVPAIPKDTPVFAIKGIQYQGSMEQYRSIKENAKACENNCPHVASVFDQLKRSNLIDIILANCASHPQFPGDERGKAKQIDFTHLPLLEKEYRRLLHLAQTEGTGYSNMSTFLIRHIYPATLS